MKCPKRSLFRLLKDGGKQNDIQIFLRRFLQETHNKLSENHVSCCIVDYLRLQALQRAVRQETCQLLLKVKVVSVPALARG